MSYNDPRQKSKDQYQSIIEKIALKDSPVGIDAQYTHAIVIEYLQQLTERLENLEHRFDAVDRKRN